MRLEHLKLQLDDGDKALFRLPKSDESANAKESHETKS